MTEINLPAIYVDGDACPVKDEVLQVAARHELNVYLVSNIWLGRDKGPNVHAIVVPEAGAAGDPSQRGSRQTRRLDLELAGFCRW